MMMIIVPNSHTHKRKKERGEVRGNMEEFVGKRRERLTTGKRYNPVSNMCKTG